MAPAPRWPYVQSARSEDQGGRTDREQPDRGPVTNLPALEAGPPDQAFVIVIHRDTEAPGDELCRDADSSHRRQMSLAMRADPMRDRMGCRHRRVQARRGAGGLHDVGEADDVNRFPLRSSPTRWPP